MDKIIDLQKLALELKSLDNCTELRDKFAMAALTGLCTNLDYFGYYNKKETAVGIWEIADAMLEARGVNNGN